LHQYFAAFPRPLLATVTQCTCLRWCTGWSFCAPKQKHTVSANAARNINQVNSNMHTCCEAGDRQAAACNILLLQAIPPPSNPPHAHGKQTNKQSYTSRSASTMGPRARVGGQSAWACNPGPGARACYTKPITRRRSLTTHTQAMHVKPHITAITQQHGSTSATATAHTTRQ
jgi:hypothetical protein